jgi:type II secretory pathway pseudopilin PulG
MIFSVQRTAFTMIELVFVIVLMGIIGAISSDLITNVHLNSLFQQDASRVHQQSRLAVEKIRAYLQRSIYDSIVHQENGNTFVGYLGQADALTGGEGDKTIQWIGKDIESLQGMWKNTENENYPGYSAFANIVTSSGAEISTSDCDLGIANTIQSALTGKTSWGNTGDYRSALFFRSGYEHYNASVAYWDGNSSGTLQALFPIINITQDTNTSNGGTLTLERKPPIISEQYMLTYSAYALHLQENNLTLFYNYRPWNGETFTDGQSAIFLEHVSSFSIWGENGGNLIRFRVCIQDDSTEIGSYCKESMVSR